MFHHIKGADEDKKFRSFIRALFNQQTGEQVLDTLCALDVPRPYGIWLKIVYSPTDPSGEIAALAHRGLCDSLSASAHTYQHDWNPKERGARSVPFLVTKLPRVTDANRIGVIAAVSRSYEWKGLTRFIARNYPRLVPVLLSQRELLDAAESLRKKSDYEVRVTSRSSRERLDPGRRKSRKSIREWTDESLDEMQQVIEERGQILKSLDLGFYPVIDGHANVAPKTTCKIRADGEIEVSGDLRLALDSVASHVGVVGQKKLASYHGRGLRDAKYKPKALAIAYAKPLFDDLAMVKSLVTTLARYSHSMYTVIHGNPYMHMRITDMHDGSSFDVWAIPPKRLAIIPGLKATEAAIERLIHYVFEEFREGKVDDYGESEQALQGSH